jgi:hypothetical protein
MEEDLVLAILESIVGDIMASESFLVLSFSLGKDGGMI